MSENIQWLITGLLGCTGLWSVIALLIQRKDNKAKEERAKIMSQIEALKTTSAETKARQALQDKAIVAQMHHTLYDACTRILQEYADGLRHCVDVDEMHDIGVMYDAYKAMGGNGTCKVLYERLLTLPPRQTNKP